MAPLQPGVPRESPKPQPIGNLPLVILLTTCTMCALFVLWRKANSIGRIVSHQMKTWTTTEGRIRLSEDDGPAATSFLGDDPTDDSDESDDETSNPSRRTRDGAVVADTPVPGIDASVKLQTAQGSIPSPTRAPLGIS